MEWKYGMAARDLQCIKMSWWVVHFNVNLIVCVLRPRDNYSIGFCLSVSPPCAPVTVLWLPNDWKKKKKKTQSPTCANYHITHRGLSPYLHGIRTFFHVDIQQKSTTRMLPMQTENVLMHSFWNRNLCKSAKEMQQQNSQWLQEKARLCMFGPYVQWWIMGAIILCKYTGYICDANCMWRSVALTLIFQGSIAI